MVGWGWVELGGVMGKGMGGISRMGLVGLCWVVRGNGERAGWYH